MWATFILMPFLAFIISLNNIAWKQYRIFLLLFLTLYGYVFVPIPDSDSTRYIENFSLYSSYSLGEFKTIISKTFTDGAENPDIYAPLLLFLTTRFATNYRVFFLIVSFIYFSVAFKLWETIWKCAGGHGFSPRTLFFLGTFFIFSFSAGINGVRWPLAFMVFSLGALKYILTNEKGYLLFAGLSILVHFALIYPLMFLLLYSILKVFSKPNIVITLLIVVLLMASIISQFISSGAGIFGSAIQAKLLGYTGEAYMETRTNHIFIWNWYIQLNMYTTRYFLIFSLIIIFIKKSVLKFDNTANRLFLFVILLLIQCVISGNILDPITNDRYYFIMFLFGLIALYYIGMINQSSKVFNILGYIYFPILLLRALIIIRTDLYTISPLLIFGNVFSILFPQSDVNIYDFLN